MFNLNKNFDTFSIAGHKMSNQLSKASQVAADTTTTTTSWSPSPSASWSPPPAASNIDHCNTPKPKRNSRPKNQNLKPTTPSPPLTVKPSPPSPSTPTTNMSPSTHMFSPSSPLVFESVTPRKAPPGFPAPLFGKYHNGKLPACLTVQLDDFDQSKSPRTKNTSYLNRTFGGADKMTIDDEKSLLQNHYEDAVLYNKDAGFHMELSNGLYYMSGHGQYKCNQVKCLDPGVISMGLPNNCTFHCQWMYPENFKPCGSECRGAYCNCIKLSSCNY